LVDFNNSSRSYPDGSTKSGDIISADETAQKIIALANAQGAEATIISANNFGSLYEIIISIDGEEFPVYATKDGKNLIPSLVPLA